MSGLFEYTNKTTSLSQKSQNQPAGIFTDSEPHSGLGISGASTLPPPLSGLHMNICQNSEEPQKFGADAITKGSHIFLSPDSRGLLRHEMGHVLQQQSGMVAARESVAGEAVNREDALERNADLLGSRIPQILIDRAIAGSSSVTSLQGIPGVVQCGKTKKGGDTSQKDIPSTPPPPPKKGKVKSPPETLPDGLSRRIAELKNGVQLANQNYNRAITLSQKPASPQGKAGIAWPKMLETEALSSDDTGSQIEHGSKLVDRLIERVQSKQSGTMSDELHSHLYRATAIGKSGSSTDATAATGLHAYSDYFDSKGRFMAAGGLPAYIQPLGFIGARTQIHLLHWKHTKTGKEKFSTMLPNNMPEQISKMLFEVASAQTPFGPSGIREFEGFDFETKGETFYPAGNNVEFAGITAEDLGLAVTGSKAGRKQKRSRGAKSKGPADSEEPVTLNDISRMLSELSGTGLAEKLSLLESMEIYHRLGS